MRKSATPVVRPLMGYTALVGRVIAQWRDDAKLRQEAIATALGISQSAYSRLEQGQSSMTVGQLRTIAGALGHSPSQLLAEADRLAHQLRSQGVEVTNDKPDSEAGFLVALGILAAIVAAAAK